VDFSNPAVPGWLRKLDCYDLDDADHRAKLVNDLRTTPEPRPIPHNVEFPAHFVRRDEEMAAVVSALTTPSGSARVAITTALRGAGGFGKTMLAKALCFENAVLTRYTDGVLWLTVGEGERSVASLLTPLLQQLGQAPQSTDQDTLFGQWWEALRTRECLVVLDDVWRESDALALVVRETASAFLITTRIPRVATAVDAHECRVDEMREDQALTVLSRPLGAEPHRFEDRLHVLADQAGYWPVLLGLIAGQLRHIVRRPGANPEQALALVEEDLSDLGLTAFDRQDAEKREYAVGRTIGASLKHLIQSYPDSRAGECYRELAVFPDNEPLETAVLKDLWGLPRADACRLAEAFDDAGLASLDVSRGLRLHDVFLAYLRSQWRIENLRGLHQRLLQHWPDRLELPYTYAWRWYGWHCVQAGESERLGAALIDLRWLSGRLAHSDLSSLLADCRRAQEGIPNQRASFAGLHDVLELSAHVLLPAPEQLAAQLYGRLQRGQSDELDALIDQTEAILAAQTLRPITQNLSPVGSPLKRTLRGHEDDITGALVLGDGRLLSWSEDRTLRLWAADGTPLAVLAGHEREIYGARELTDGRLLSRSNDETLRLWAADGTPLAVLGGHGASPPLPGTARWPATVLVAVSTNPTSATRAKKIGKLLILRSRIFKGRHYKLDFLVRR
jgi:NB-ARC domain/APAF-1 helical domain